MRFEETVCVLPTWYGTRYPTMHDLDEFAWSLGASVVYGNVQAACYFPGDHPVIVIPQRGPLAMAWDLAHELGHLVMHMGYTSPWSRSKQEHQADRWAACALIPTARIAAHGNASLNAFVGALSAHYEHLPASACSSRELAGEISQIRLTCLEVSSCAG